MRWVALLAVAAALGVLTCARTTHDATTRPRARVAPRAAVAPSLTIRVLDVGDSPVGGLAVLLADSSGTEARHVLIDGGEQPLTALRALRALGVDSLALVVLTHPHSDHFGGLVEVVSALPVGAFAWSGDTRTLERFQRLLEVVDSSGIRPIIVDREDRAVTLPVGPDTLTLLLIAPSPVERARQGGDPVNNRSVGVLVRYGAFSALVPGDAEHLELADWMRRLGRALDVDVLVASHHGSRDANSTARNPRWYRIVTPRALLIAANGRQHPFGRVLDYARAQHIPTYCTSAHGALGVRATRDGVFAVSTERSGTCGAGSERPR
jgi:competence protein ComEC